MFNFSSSLLRHRKTIIAITLVVLVFSAFGIRRINFDTDYKRYLSESDLKDIEHLEDMYGKDINALFVLAPKSGNIFERESVQAIQWLTDESWQIPYSSRVDSLNNFQFMRASGDDLTVENFIKNPEKITDAELEDRKKTALKDLRLLKKLISEDGKVSAVNVNLTFDQRDFGKSAEFSRYIADLRKRFEQKFPEIDLHLTGSAVLNQAFNQAAIQDLTTFVPAMYLLILIMLWVLLRSPVYIYFVLQTLSITIIVALGLSGWLGIPLTTTSAIAPSIIMTLAVADSLHFFVTYMEERSHGHDKQLAIKEAIQANGKAMAVTAFTTAVGFLSMNFSVSSNYRDLGNIVAMGVVTAFWLSLFFTPSLLSLLPIQKNKYGKAPKFSSSLVAGVADFAIRKRRPILLVFVPLVVLISFCVLKNEVNEDFVKILDESLTIRKDTDFTVKNLSGIFSIEHSVSSGKEGGVSETSYLKFLESFGQWYRAQPETSHVSVITDTMKSINQSMQGGGADQYKLPESKELSAQYLLLYELALPFGHSLNNFINVDKSATRMVVLTKDIKNNQMIQLNDRAESWAKENTPKDLPKLNVFTSGSIGFAKVTKENIDSMLQGGIIDLLVVSLALILAVGSIKMGILSLVPNLLPATLALGVWGLTYGTVGLAVSSVIAMTIGVIVDDTTHFLLHYQKQRELGFSAEESVRSTFSHSGVAILFTTIILSSGFFVLSFSSFKMNSDVGILTSMIIVFALLGDFLLLPALLVELDNFLINIKKKV